VRVGPRPGDQSPMPTQQRVGLHQEAGPAGSREDAADLGEQRPIGRLQLGTWDLSAQDGELVAQHEDLQVLGGLATSQQHEQLDRAAERQVGELRQRRVLSERSAEASHYRGVVERTASLEAMSAFAHPTGLRCPGSRSAGWGLASRSGQHPGPIPPGQTQGEQPAQVQRRDPDRQPHVIALEPVVGHPPTAVGDQPGDRPFHHRPLVNQRRRSGSLRVRLLQSVEFMHYR
jgi:hypothetical protein